MEILTKRLAYIDAMRGFTMILVVFSHVQYFGYGEFIQSVYNPQIEMFARFKMKSSFHKTKRII